MTGLGPLDQRLLALFDGGEAVLLAVAVAVVVAVAAGALHAAAPGHGKTLAAATLVGPHGRPVHALALGLSVAGMHTASVAVLAGGWYALVDGAGAGMGNLTATLQLVAASAAVVVAVGMLRHHLGPHRGHHHHHDHDGRGADPVPPWSRRGLVAVAMSGGLVPSPSAFLILVTGILSGRVGVAVALVAAFAFGLATTLTIVGLLAVAGRDVLSSATRRVPWLAGLVARLPVLAAIGVLIGAAVLGVGAIGDLSA